MSKFSKSTEFVKKAIIVFDALIQQEIEFKIFQTDNIYSVIDQFTVKNFMNKTDGSWKGETIMFLFEMWYFACQRGIRLNNKSLIIQIYTKCVFRFFLRG